MPSLSINQNSYFQKFFNHSFDQINAHQPLINEAGYLNDPQIRAVPFPNLEHGNLKTVHALVLHRTSSPDAASTLKNYKTSRFGAHFLIDTNGDIYQTASLNKTTQHVGKIRSRCKEEQTCSLSELQDIKEIKAVYEKHNGKWVKSKLTPLAKHEMKKDYPDRYPYNADSIGIEVVGLFDKKNQTYGPATQEQLQSLKYLVEKLKTHYGLTDRDIFKHKTVSYKQPSEGEFLGY